MQPIYRKHYGWTVDCDCDVGRIWNNADPSSGQWIECDDCGGRGFHELTDDEAEELLAPSEPVDPVMMAKAKAAFEARYPALAAFGGVA